MNQSLIIPPFILIIYLLSIYAIPVRQHIQFLLNSHQNASIAFLTLFFLSYILSLSSYLRALITVNTNPGSIPLDPKRSHESFFLLDAYVCEPDGRPKWCFECQQRKPDRAHHSHKLGRCIAKMDHECPWVGGVVSQTSFNFFLQFTFYTFILCAITFSSSVYTLSLQIPHKDPWVIISTVLSGLFGGFTGSMTLTVLRFVLTNYTLIEFRRRRDTKYLAVRISPDTPQGEYPTMTFPSDHGERKFAILEVKPRQNIWDLGYWRNWKSVMGDGPLRWLLPIWHSPCCETKTEALDYPLGDVVEKLKRKYHLPVT